jgi:hypothetical protein
MPLIALHLLCFRPHCLKEFKSHRPYHFNSFIFDWLQGGQGTPFKGESLGTEQVISRAVLGRKYLKQIIARLG